MRIDPVSLARSTARLSHVSDLLRRFEQGESLQGRVLAVRGSQVLIAVLGKQIAAESRVPLQLGQILNLVAREIRPDQVILHIAPQTTGNAPALHTLTQQDLGDLLAGHGLPADSTNVLISRALIRHALPITHTIVLAARQAVSFVETPTAGDIDAAIFLMTRELPVTPQSLEPAKTVLLNPNSLGARVQALATQLVELLSQTAPGDAAATLPEPLLTLAYQVLQELPLLLPDHAQGQAFGARLRQVLDRIGTPMEARLARLLDETDIIPLHSDSLPGQGEAQPPDTRATRAAIIEPPPLTSQEHPDLAPMEGHHVRSGARRPQPHEIARDFRQQLALLGDTLDQAVAELPRGHSSAPLLHQLQATIRETIAMVEANQLANAGMPPPTQPQGHYVFHLPIAAAGQDVPDTAEVRVYYQRKDRNRRVDPNNAHLAFLLQMSRLGPVEVHVDLYDKHVRCRIESSRQDTAELFRESSHELQERLHTIGYIVDAIRSTTTRLPDAHSEGASMSSLFTIDVQA